MALLKGNELQHNLSPLKRFLNASMQENACHVSLQQSPKINPILIVIRFKYEEGVFDIP